MHRRLHQGPQAHTLRVQAPDDPFSCYKKKYKKTNCPTGSEGQLQRRYSKNIWEMTSPGSMRACQGFVLCQEQPSLECPAFIWPPYSCVIGGGSTLLACRFCEAAILTGQLFHKAASKPSHHQTQYAPLTLALTLSPPFMEDFCLFYCFLICISLIIYFFLMKNYI